MSTNFQAYDAKYHALETIMRMHSVKRWHMIDTTRQQTLAEHTANVAMLVLLILQDNPDLPLGRGCNTARAVIAALTHDIPESFTGDVPTHTKREIGGLKELEAKVTPKSFAFDVPTEAEILIKLCDLADGIRFIRLHGVDLTARHAQVGLEAQFAARMEEAHILFGDSMAMDIRHKLRFYAYENS